MDAGEWLSEETKRRLSEQAGAWLREFDLDYRDELDAPREIPVGLSSDVEEWHQLYGIEGREFDYEEWRSKLPHRKKDRHKPGYMKRYMRQYRKR